MARPKTRGARIVLFLPLALDERVRAEAESLGVPAGEVVARLVGFVYGNPEPTPPPVRNYGRISHGTDIVNDTPVTAAPADSPITPIQFVPQAACAHRGRRLVLPGGMARCVDCNAIRDMRGIWRQNTGQP